MVQTIYTPMRAGQVVVPVHLPGINLADTAGASDPGWTQGATLIDPVSITPPLAEQWTLLAWGFTFAGAWTQPAVGPSYGKLGSLWAGVLTQAEAPTGSDANTPWANPMLPLPPDLTTFQKVWDGAGDPIFPNVTQQLAAASVAGSASENLPQPLPIVSGRPLAFGVWLTPSLVKNLQLLVQHATFSLVYDDGIKEPSPL